jgi:hypothetical protein
LEKLKNEGKEIMENECRYSVMSPETGIKRVTGAYQTGVSGPDPSSFVFANRLDTLDNKTVYLVNIGFGGGNNFMLQLQKWFSKNMPSVTTIVKRKPGRVFADDNHSLWEEVKKKGHAVIIGVAG